MLSFKSHLGGVGISSTTPAVVWMIVLLLLTSPNQNAGAATIIITTDADTSLQEVGPDNNHGGFIGMNAGTTQNFTKNRALFRFNLSSLPTSTLVQYASVQLEVTREPNEPPSNTTFGLHRMLKAWGEGNKNPTSFVGQGLPADPGEATWNYAFYPTNAWSAPGGASGVDFSDVESAFQFIYGTANSPYQYPSTPEMVSDAAYWIANPQNNYGWMLLCNGEASNFTARRFGTREDVNHQPLLELHYLVPPRLSVVKTNTGQSAIEFTAWADHSYDIEYRDSLFIGNWQTLGHINSSPTNHTEIILDTNTVARRFYRANAY